jgi:hypothetical protein
MANTDPEPVRQRGSGLIPANKASAEIRALQCLPYPGSGKSCGA